MDSTIRTPPSPQHLTAMVCWTRMQAEAGQDLKSIIARKELERRVGGGLFFWGIGNAPNRSIKDLAAKGSEIDVVFSLMKTKARSEDSAPSGVLVWQSYFDNHGDENELPPHALITSRTGTATGTKRTHYALVCSSERKLQLEDHGPFDPLAYRNVSEAAAPVSPSQVTALVIRTAKESPESSYRVNFQARLVGSYWVRLGQPTVLPNNARRALTTAFARSGDLNDADWMKVVSGIRQHGRLKMKSRSPLASR
jgi:hypothetical protein